MNLSCVSNDTTTPIVLFQEPDDNSVLGTVVLVASFLVMSTNAVVIFVIVKIGEVHLPTLWLITHMAVWDFFLGLHYIIFSVPSAFLNKFAYSEKAIGVASCLYTFIVAENLFSVAMVAIDRCIAIKRPLFYIHIITKKKMGIAVVVSALLSVVRVLLTVLPAEKFMFYKDIAASSVKYSNYGAAAGSVIPIVLVFLVIFICLAVIFKEICHGRRQSHPEGAAPRAETAMFSRLVLLSAGVYCLSYVPAVIAIAFAFVPEEVKESVSEHYAKFVFVSILCNSIWNVFIYTATYGPFREALMSIFCQSYLRKRRQAEVQAIFSNRRNNEVVSIQIIS